jgi:hypothetical protein
MGLRGLIRDLVGVFVGVRLVLSFLFPLSGGELVLSGLLVAGFSGWFMLERLGFIKK